MKKFIPSFLAYALFAAAAVFAASFFLLPMASVANGSQTAYKTTNALCSMLDFLPSILFTAFLLACSIEFSNVRGAGARFSAEIALVFKKIIVAALLVTFAATLGTLVFLPFETSKKKVMQEITPMLSEYLETARLHRLQKKPGIASQYVKRALILDPNNKDLKKLDRQLEAEQKELEAIQRAERNKSYNETNLNSNDKSFLALDESKMSPEQMTKKAKECFDNKDFFEAHYLSVQAESISEAGSSSAKEARELAEKAWERLQKAQMEELTAGNIFFRKKMQGYTALINGDFEEAYYIFHDLSQEDARKARDPDVIRYLDKSQTILLENYFFIDETYDASRFESANNIYFAIPHDNGERDVVLIRGVTDVEGSGGMLRYLRGLSIHSFDQYGKWKSSMSTPYAKMMSRSVLSLDKESAKDLSAPQSVKNVPFVMLRSVSRDSRENKNEPVWTFNEKSANGGAAKEKLFFPIPYEDFSLILISAAGNGNLNPFSLNRMARKAPDYGYSSEVFSVESLNRIFYPFMFLIILIFVATIAWNYRLASGAIFKFKWIFILPSLNAVFYLAESFIEYVIRLFNFVFVAIAGTYMALFAGIIAYIFLLALVSVVFLSRKND